jgi:hypothetical protein
MGLQALDIIRRAEHLCIINIGKPPGSAGETHIGSTYTAVNIGSL